MCSYFYLNRQPDRIGSRNGFSAKNGVAKRARRVVRVGGDDDGADDVDDDDNRFW